jgi:diphthamide biosynthesis methyltransferase
VNKTRRLIMLRKVKVHGCEIIYAEKYTGLVVNQSNKLLSRFSVDSKGLKINRNCVNKNVVSFIEKSMKKVIDALAKKESVNKWTGRKITQM